LVKGFGTPKLAILFVSERAYGSGKFLKLKKSDSAPSWLRDFCLSHYAELHPALLIVFQDAAGVLTRKVL
jgi:hypothetical protein